MSRLEMLDAVTVETPVVRRDDGGLEVGRG